MLALLGRRSSAAVKKRHAVMLFRHGSDLKSILEEKIKCERERLTEFRKKHSKFKVCEVTINQIYGGMRGIVSMLCETSLVDPNTGITFRGLSIPELRKQLPHVENEPLPEGVFWLMLTEQVPTKEQVDQLSCEWSERSKLPPHVEKMLKGFPKTLHPMSQLSAAMTVLNHDSKFLKAYNKGTKKLELWKDCYEDAMDLIAKVIVVSGKIYVNTYKDGKGGADCADPANDWSENYALMMGIDNCEFKELLRMYLTIHSDHEGGNVSAHTVHLVGSALSDPYLSYAAGMNGLAGPLHGLANQEVLTWIMALSKELGKDASEEKLKAFCEKTLKSGRVIPGYGHAVLRSTDPRYTCQAEFAKKYMPDDELFKVVQNLFKVVPPILKATGKVQNPWPNVDAHSGVLLYHYGLKEMQYYTVLFSVSRALGTMAQLIWSRAFVLPIERPKSVNTYILEEMVKKADKGGKDGCKPKK